MKTTLIAALLTLAALASAPAAYAGIVPGVAVDGPDPNIGTTDPRIDVAPDDTAALVYLKKVGATNHPFVSRFAAGVWTAPQQVDAPADPDASTPRIAVANGGKVVVTYVTATDVIARISPSAGAPFGPAQAIRPGGKYGNVDLSPNGNGYAVTSDNNKVAAVRLAGATWTAVGAGDLNNDSTQTAGDGNNEAQVAASADGASGVIAWGEAIAGPAGTDTFARRLTGNTAGPQAGVRLASFPGANPIVNGVADQPDVDMDAAGTAWVVFRQDLQYGALTKNRAFVRPFTGDTFGAAQLVDGMPSPPPVGRDFQRIDVNGPGQGLITHYGNLSPFEFELATLAAGTWTTGATIDAETNGGVPLGTPALGENGSGLVAYKFESAPTDVIVRGRTTLGGLGAIQTLSNPAFGPATGALVDSGAGKGDFAAVTFIQTANAADRRIVAAVVDLPQPQTTPPTDTNPPDVTGVSLSRKRFRLGRALPSAAAVKTGTTIRLTLSEAATLRLTYRRLLPGRRVGGTCRKLTRRNRGRRRCTRLVSVRGANTFAAQAGARRIRFQGRLSRKRSLKPGPYQLAIIATDAAGNRSTPDTARFTLLPRKKRR